MWSTPLLSLDKNGELVPALMGMPRAVHSAFVAPAVPNWKLFVYGGHGTDREKAVSRFFFFSFFLQLSLLFLQWNCLLVVSFFFLSLLVINGVSLSLSLCVLSSVNSHKRFFVVFSFLFSPFTHSEFAISKIYQKVE